MTTTVMNMDSHQRHLEVETAPIEDEDSEGKSGGNSGGAGPKKLKTVSKP
jgi:hypothetical protein